MTKKVVRTSKATFDPHRADEVVALLLETRVSLWPEQERLPGYVDGYLGVDRQNGTMIWVTFWDSVEHAQALGPLMVPRQPSFKARGVTFEPVTHHDMV